MPYNLDREEKRTSDQRQTCHRAGSISFLRQLIPPAFDRRSTDPLVHNGRHFGRSIHALCNIHALINNGIIRMGERADEPDEAFTAQ